MTEAEWLNADEVLNLVPRLRKSGTARQRQLLACAMCRSFTYLLADARLLQALELIEARGSKALNRKNAASLVAEALADQSDQEKRRLYFAVLNACRPSGWLNACFEAGGVEAIDATQGVAFAHCIFGNPFRSVTFLPEWRTSTVLSLAQQMYDSRDFSAMPILADALQDSGCTEEAILTHCRGTGPHVRGCHVVDACLSKS